MNKALAVRIVAAAAMLALVASCGGNTMYRPVEEQKPGFVLVKDLGKEKAPEPEAPKETAEEPAGGTGEGEIRLLGDIVAARGAVAEREAVAELYMRAQRHYYDGDLAAARRLLARVQSGQPYYDMVQRLLRVIEDDVAKAAAEARLDREERQHRDDIVQALFRKAEEAYNAKRYAEAVRIIEEAYRLDPESPKVRSLRADARIMQATEGMRDNSSEQDIRIAEFMGAVEKVGTIPSELPRAPRPKPGDEVDEEDAEAARILEEKLNQRISVNLDDTPLDYLLNILFRATGVNIIANPDDLADQTIKVQAEDIKLKELLNYISKVKGVTFTRSGNAIWMQGGGSTTAGPVMQWRVVPLDKGLIDVSTQDISESSDLEKVLEQVQELIEWPDGSKYYLDRKTNKLFVRTTSEAMTEFIDLVRAVDVTPVQVLIDAKFIEVSNKDLTDIGVEWHTTSDYAITKKDGSPNLQIDAGMGVTLPAPVAPGADFPVAGFDAILAGVMTVPQFQMTLHALRATGHTSTLGEPRVVAVNNSTTDIEITRDLYYVSDIEFHTEDIDFAGENAEIDTTVVIEPKYGGPETLGFKLKVSPSVGRDLKDITLYIEPEITDLVEMLETPISTEAALKDYSGDVLQIQKPIMSKRTLKAKVTVSDGYVVVLGGLVRQTKEKGEVKVPLLGDIPLLGELFRRETEKNIKTNLLIFVSAKIITSEGRMYTGAGPETLDLGGPSDEARDLLNRIEVEVD